MNTFLSTIKYFRKKKELSEDILANQTQIKLYPFGESVKIVYRQLNQSVWKYCLAPTIFGTILYTFLKIKKSSSVHSTRSLILQVLIEINLLNLGSEEKKPFKILSAEQINRVIKTVFFLGNDTFDCIIKNIEEKQKKLCFKFVVKKQQKLLIERIIKTSFFVLVWILNRLKIYAEIKQKKQNYLNTDLTSLRLQFFHNKPEPIDKNEKHERIKNQFLQTKKQIQIITCKPKNLYNDKNLVILSFEQNLKRRDELKKSFEKIEEERKQSIKKEKIYSNIDIQQSQNLEGFQIQTKFSLITYCNLVFKIIRTHINARANFSKSSANADYYNRMLEQSRTQQRTLVKKQPLQIQAQISQRKSQNQTSGKDQVSKTLKVLRTQKNCLDIMKESEASNICSYYVNYKQEDTIYSRFYKRSLDQWKESNTSNNNEVLIDVFLQLLNGLYEMSLYNIIHRDLKPDNIVMDESNPFKPILKLIDFGSAIYSYSESQSYEQEVQENFDPKLRTTKAYNLDFSEFKKICAQFTPQTSKKYSQASYNRHQKFDMYSVGKIMEDFKERFTNESFSQNLEYLIKICQCPDPQFRLGIEDVALFLTTIKNFYIS